MNRSQMQNIEEIPKQKFKCKLFDKSFGSRKDPKMHLKSEHKQKVKCKKCEETFERNCDLEEHIVASMK